MDIYQCFLELHEDQKDSSRSRLSAHGDDSMVGKNGFHDAVERPSVQNLRSEGNQMMVFFGHHIDSFGSHEVCMVTLLDRCQNLGFHNHGDGTDCDYDCKGNYDCNRSGVGVDVDVEVHRTDKGLLLVLRQNHVGSEVHR